MPVVHLVAALVADTTNAGFPFPKWARRRQPRLGRAEPPHLRLVTVMWAAQLALEPWHTLTAAEGVVAVLLHHFLSTVLAEGN
jgi:hypothetical protein